MKTKTFTLCCFLIINLSISAQCPDIPVMGIMAGNAVEAAIGNGGDLFFDSENGHFRVPVEIEPHRNTIFAAGLWIGGYDANHNLKLSAQTYGRYSNNFDYTSGPLNPETGEQLIDHCENFNKIWKVEKQDILDHIADFADNGIIDNPINSIYAWPGNNNPHSIYYNGFILPINPQKWAPFHDVNNNGNYDPEDGDYPHPEHVIPNLIPEQVSWTVFNDNTIHYESNSDPLVVEVQLTSWNFTCVGNHPLKHSLFTSHKIINRSQQNIDSMYVGLFVDFDLGCPSDDYIGSAPEQDGFFAYNADALDGGVSPADCSGLQSYGDHPPAQSVTFLNQKLDKFMYYRGSGGVLPPPDSYYFPPENADEYFNYLTGKWSNGMPLTYGNDGYNLSGNGIPTDYAYPGNPNDANDWSLTTENAPNGERLAVGSSFVGTLSPGEVFKIDMAHTYHGYETLNNLESANQAFIEMEQMEQMYDQWFNGWCNDIVAGIDEIPENVITVFPNPTNGILHIAAESLSIDQIDVYDQLGRLMQSVDFEKSKAGELNLSGFASGVYILKIRSGGATLNKKVLRH